MSLFTKKPENTTAAGSCGGDRASGGGEVRAHEYTCVPALDVNPGHSVFTRPSYLPPRDLTYPRALTATLSFAAALTEWQQEHGHDGQRHTEVVEQAAHEDAQRRARVIHQHLHGVACMAWCGSLGTFRRGAAAAIHDVRQNTCLSPTVQTAGTGVLHSLARSLCAAPPCPKLPGQ